MRGRRGCRGSTRCIQRETLKMETWTFGRSKEWSGIGGGALMRVEMIMVLDCGQSEMVLNSCLEYVEGRMKLKRMWKLIPQVGKKKNK